MAMPDKIGRVYKGLWGLLTIQVVCAILLMIWISGELYHEMVGVCFGCETEAHRVFQSHTFQFIIVALLLISLAPTIWVLHRLEGRNTRKDELLRAATGDYYDLVQQYFDEWGLTPSERDVAILSIKGLMISEIAQLRQTKLGTIKAQCASIYRKAGISGRPQLLSLFLDELIAMGMSGCQDRCPNSAGTGTEKPN